MQDQPTSELPVLIDKLRQAVVELPGSNPESLLATAADVRACVELARQQAGRGELPESEAAELFVLLEQFSTQLGRAQARTERAMQALGIGQTTYENPTGLDAVSPRSNPTRGRAHFTA